MFKKGEKGFTLIELLIVVAILGVLVAIIVPNVMHLIGTGTVEAANTEAHDVQIATLAYMVENNLFDFDGVVGVGTTTGVEEYLLHPDGLQASYTITNGEITSATPLTDGKWKDLTYSADIGWNK